MNEIITTIIFAINLIALSLYFILQGRKKVLIADASFEHVSASQRKPSKDVKFPSQIIFPSGKNIYPNDMICVQVVGNSMNQCGINSGDVVLFEPKKNTKIKSEDVVLLYMPDDKQYKVRVVRELSSKTDNIVTYHYADDGSKHISSKNAREQNIIGVARYILADNIMKQTI